MDKSNQPKSAGEAAWIASNKNRIGGYTVSWDNLTKEQRAKTEYVARAVIRFYKKQQKKA